MPNLYFCPLFKNISQTDTGKFQYHARLMHYYFNMPLTLFKKQTNKKESPHSLLNDGHEEGRESRQC